MKRTPLRRRAQLRARKPLRRTTPLQRTDSMAATEAQRAAVAGRPASSAARRTASTLRTSSLGRSAAAATRSASCRSAAAVPRAYDSGELDLLPHLEPAWRAQLAHAVGHVGLIGALRRISGSAARPLTAVTRSPDERLDRALELMGQQRLEWRTAARTLARAALSPMDTGRRDSRPLVRQIARQLGAVRAVRDAADDHGVDVEPEAEREHEADGSAAARREQDDAPGRYAPGEDGVVAAATAAGSHARPSPPRRTWRASTASSRRSRARGPPSWPPRRRSSPRHPRAQPAPRPWSRRAASGEASERGVLVRRVGAALRLRGGGLGAVAPSRSRAAGLRRGRLRGARAERGERLAEAVGLMDELVEALLDLFTQTVDHGSVSSRWGAGDRTRTRSPEVSTHFPRGPSHRPPHQHTRTAAPNGTAAKTHALARSLGGDARA